MEQHYKLIVGCDVAAVDFKNEIIRIMRNNQYQITDAGCDNTKDGLYTTIAKKVADAVVAGEHDYGLLFCGTGQGMAMAANKIPGIKAALCYDIFPAVMSKEHNNANILCTGAWMMDVPKAMRMIEAWLFARYAGNHDVGLNMLEGFEKERTHVK